MKELLKDMIYNWGEELYSELIKSSHLTGTYTTEQKQEQKPEPLTKETVLESIEKLKKTMNETHPLYKLAKENGFDLIAGDKCVIPEWLAIKFDIQQNDTISISRYINDIIFYKKGKFQPFAL